LIDLQKAHETRISRDYLYPVLQSPPPQNYHFVDINEMVFKTIAAIAVGNRPIGD
jgi:hypothetical protein